MQIRLEPGPPRTGGEPEAAGPAPERRGDDKASWGFEQGDPIADGRTVLKPLGGGSRYEVFLVWDDALLAIMVAKVIRPDQVEDGRALRELAQEADALEQLAHPVIVRGFDAVLEGPYPHLLLEHLEGPSLHSRIRRHGRLVLQELLPLALHLAAALHYMTTRRMVHLDVKPDNVIMGIPPRLVDLSIARSFERAARVSGHVGTDAYMAPEQCDPESFPGLIGPPADVFGLAATVYHAATGRKPFPRSKAARGRPEPELRFPQLVEPPKPPPSNLPAELAELLLSGLAKDPAARPTAREFALGLEPLVAALPRKLVLGKRGARTR
jgi:eukaryotic-like serine/threonine-protein kinase